jgi:hypothetical protein
MAEIEQMLDGHPRSAYVIYIYKGDVALWQLSHQDNWHTFAVKLDEFGIVRARAGEHDPVYVPLTDEMSVNQAILARLLSVEKDMIAVLMRGLLKPMHHLGKESIGSHSI